MTKSTYRATKVQCLYQCQPLGIYYARVSIRGHRKWVSLGTKNFQVAKQAVHKLLQEHLANRETYTSIQKGKATVGDLANVYLQSIELDHSIKASTKEYRQKTIKYLFKSWPTLKTKIPNRVSEIECRHWAAEYRAKFSETLFNNTTDSLRHLFDLAIKHGLITRNPAAGVEKVRVPQKKLELPSSSEFRQIVDVIRNSGSATSNGNGDLVEFLAYSGLRATEAAGVRWQDVDLDRNRIYVAPGKNDQSRIVPILDSMRDLLERIQATPRWFRSEQRRKGGFILSCIECEKSLTAACTKVGTHRLTRHNLRHLFATRCVESGVDIPTVSRWLGHKDGGGLCMRTYGHLRDQHSQEMALKVKF